MEEAESGQFDHEGEFVMPFVCVQSVYGPYDDDGFVAGFQMGHIDGKLSSREIDIGHSMIFEDLIKQADLIAMRHGYSTTVVSQSDEWAEVQFDKIPDDSNG